MLGVVAMPWHESAWPVLEKREASPMRQIGLAAAAAAFTLSSTALGQGTITDGNATYTLTPPTTQTSNGGSAEFRPDGPSTTNHMFQDWWYWRVNGVSTREFTFSSAAGFNFTQSYVGNTATLSWTGLSSGLFNAQLRIIITDGAAAGAAGLLEEMTITNTSGAALDLSLFSYADFDIDGGADFGDDLASISGDIVTLTDNNSPTMAQFAGFGADAFQATAFSALRGRLTDTDIDNLDNTGYPFGPGDFTGGFQWNRVIGAGESMTFLAAKAINQDVVPAPSGLAVLALAGLRSRRRRM
jgi:hypothetical protein